MISQFGERVLRGSQICIIASSAQDKQDVFALTIILVVYFVFLISFIKYSFSLLGLWHMLIFRFQMSLVLLTLGMVDILCLVYSSFCTNKLIIKCQFFLKWTKIDAFELKKDMHASLPYSSICFNFIHFYQWFQKFSSIFTDLI